MESKKQQKKISWWKIQQIRTPNQINRALKGSAGGGNIPIITDGNVFGIATTTNIQFKPTTKTLEQNMNQLTLAPLKQKTYQSTILSVQDFLAKHSHLLETGKGLKMLEAQCFLKLCELLKLKEPSIYSLKMSKGYSITTKGKLSPQSFKRWKNWGMKFNGWFLTANFLVFPKIEKGFSLSQILQEQVSPKYFLSEKMQERFKEYMKTNKWERQKRKK